MTTFTFRKTLTALVSAAILSGGLLASAGSADAKPWPKPFPGPFGGFGPAAFVGGLALGAIAASAAEREDDCMIVRRVVVDDVGNEYVRRVRVCD